jgi:integrase
MRSVEIKGLRIDDVSLIDREVIIGKSKTPTGQRRIPLNDAAMWAFARLLERARGLGAIDPDHFLFPRFLYRRTKAAGRGTGYRPTQP